MKPFVKAIIGGGCVILLGVIILIIALGLNNWTLKANFTAEEFTAEEENSKIILENSVGSVKINYYDGDRVEISYPESKNYKMSITEKDGTVKISSYKPHWYEFSIWWADVPETVVNLPKDTVFELKLTVNAGSLRLDEGKYSKVNLTVNAGTLNASGVECDTFDATVNAGSMQINKLNCHTSFVGDVNAGSMSVKEVTCPKIAADVSAGSLSMKVNGVKDEYTIDVSVSAGSCNLSNQTRSTDKIITADVSAGSLSITFTS